MTSLAEKIVAVHRSLDAADVPHAFGGALALAWCTRQPRGTSDIDVNVFASRTNVRRVLAALPPEVVATRSEVRQLERDGQARLHWDTTPVDVFLNTTPFHGAAATRSRAEPFAGEMVPFLSCFDVAVFKAFFDRRRDWADLEDMLAAGALDVDAVVVTLTEHLGPNDERIARLRSL
ncbi:MAG TPA: hypothetical protein VGZ52_01055 [Acidimicrobiales bacterium]|nr:hypothetical protein [Acidimicrobiales bacterium]